MKKNLTILLFILISCARAPLEKREMALSPVDSFELKDDLNLEPLILGIKKIIEIIEKNHTKFLNFTFGEIRINEKDYAKSLKYLVRSYEQNPNGFLQTIKDNFDFYEVYGGESRGEILLTSYYEPIIYGSLKKTGNFSRPLYRVPPDLVEISLKEFNGKDFPVKIENPRTIYARLVPTPENDIKSKVIPYFSRKEIDQDQSLKFKKLEICYVDPVEAFFLQIQGSGTVILPKGKKIRVGYAGQNGWIYHPIGKELMDIMPVEEINMEKIENHLESLPPDKRDEMMAKNPSYVFFKEIKNKPLTTLGVEVIDGRTIATDLRFFPKGALAFIKFDGPDFEPEKKYSRLVLDLDTGGAIKGGGRADLFWGSGPDAKKYAGSLKSKANLYYLAPNPALLAKLKLENQP